MTNPISENTMKMLQREAAEVFLAEIRYDFLNGDQRKAMDVAVSHALSHALEEGIVELPHPHYSSTYECPECHSEVDLREARAL